MTTVDKIQKFDLVELTEEEKINITGGFLLWGSLARRVGVWLADWFAGEVLSHVVDSMPSGATPPYGGWGYPNCDNA